MRTGSPENTRRQRPTPFGPQPSRTHSYSLIRNGTYNVPDTMPFGTYAAIPWPKGGCAFYIYDSTGKLYNSGSYTNAFDMAVVEVNPFASKGRFQTVGCSPWVMIKPLSPDW